VREKIDIMVAGRSKTAIGALEKKLQSTKYNVSQRFISNGHSNPLFGVGEWPDILVFHLSTLSEDEINSLLENPAELRPATIVIGPANNMKCIRMAMQAGVRDYLEEPLNDQELQNSLDRICAELQAKDIQENESAMTAALLELDLQFGSLAQYLDLHPKHGLVTALDMADQLDAVALDAYMAKHQSGLALMSPLDEEILLTRDIDATRFSRVLDLLKESYSRIIVDLPRQIDELSADVYERADHILMVTQQEIASVRDAARLRKLILTELDVPAERISVVINRYDKSSAVELKDIARSMGVDKESFILVPNSYKSVAESINIGVPMLDHARNSSVTKAIMAARNQIEGRNAANDKSVVGRVLSNLIGV
jgi:pilus assembly protein CpaE